MLLGGIIATLSGLATAKLNQYDIESINNGLYGYNSALVGIAVFFFFPVSYFSLFLLVFGGAFATVIMHFMLVRMPNFPPFTAPFIISTWLIFLIIEICGLSVTTIAFSTDVSGHFYSVMRGVGQVMFQDYWLSGVIFIFGLFISSYKVATWAVIGSALGMLIAGIFNFSEDLLLMGVYGFNASLVAIALADKYEKLLWPIALAIVLAVFLTRIFELLTLPALTAPFVLASWLIFSFVKVGTYIQDSYNSR